MKTKPVYWKRTVLLLLLFFAGTTTQAQRGRHYGGYGYYPVMGQHFLRVPGPYLSLNFGGYPYYYSAGLFYRPYGSYFEIAAPPIGISIGALPMGYWPLRWSGYPYYYYNGIFYRPNNNQYEVVQAPVGAEVPSIPRDSKTTVIDGQKYYEYNGTYYKDFVKANGELWYKVEGKHGVLNTDNTAQNTPAPQPKQLPKMDNNKPSIGDVFDKLPGDYRTIVINSKKYFVADNIYYEEVIDGTQVRYKVAGR